MRRYASIDFLRGMAIWLMLLFHAIQRVYDWSWATDESKADMFAKMPIIYVILMLVILFLASWAGFFLLISSVGNTISVQKTLRRGGSVKSVVIKQLLLGFLLLIVAFLTESITGYHGWLGEAVIRSPFSINLLYRSFIAETIHAIAYAMIINALITGLLSLRNGYKKEKRNIFIYLGLAVFVIVLTFIIYQIPTQYGPHPNVNTLQDFGIIQGLTSPPVGITIKEFFIKFFALPFIGRPEPLLPFLATAFIGNILGIWMAREKPFWKEMKIGMATGTFLTLGGLVWALVMVANDKEDLFHLFESAWSLASLTAWLPMFLFTLGTQIIAVLLVIRLVDFRGRGKDFANKTKYFRLHGFVALSIYNYQFFDVIPRWFLASLPCVPSPDGCITGMILPNGGLADNTLWGPWTLFVIVINFLIWYGILLLWKKINFIGGFEWIINVIAGVFIKSRRIKETDKGTEKYPWWKPKRLDVETNFNKVDWINLVEQEEILPKEKKESILALKITAINLILNAFVFFLPISIFGTMIAFSARKTEGKNRLNTAAIIIGILGFVVFIAAIVVMSNIPIEVLGL